MYSRQRIRELLETRRLTVAWLAYKTGYHVSTVSRFLHGHYPISDEFAGKAALAFEVPLEWLREPEVERVA